MPKNDKTLKKLGLSFGAEDIVLAEVEHTAGRFRISKVITFELDLPFNLETFESDTAAQQIGNSIAEILTENEIETKDVAISLDLSHLVIIQVPIDADLKNKEINDQITWELSQYINSPVNLYDYDYDKLSISTKKNTVQLLITGTRKKITDFFLDVANHANLHLSLVDVDILASLNAFTLNYKTALKDKIVLIEVGNEKIVFTLIKNNRFLGYHILMLDSSRGGLPVDKIVTKIKSNMRILFSDYQLGEDSETFDRKYLYKSSAAINLNEIADTGKELNLEIINPFEKIRIAPELHEEIDTFTDNSLLLEPVGLAIRK